MAGIPNTMSQPVNPQSFGAPGAYGGGGMPGPQGGGMPPDTTGLGASTMGGATY